MKKKPVTHMAIILDRSGSMENLRQEAVGAFNDQLKVAQEAEHSGNENYVTLVTFSTFVDEPHYFAAAANKVPQLTSEMYKPTGSTALLDAMADTISRLKGLPDSNDDNTSFLVAVITDGEENSSREYSHHKDGAKRVADMLKSLEETGRWTFVYLCANVDPTKIMTSLKLSIGNVRGFTADSFGLAAASIMHQDATTGYFKDRLEGKKSKLDFYEKANPSQDLSEGSS